MMVVKMEDGWDRVKAAAFSYASTAMPRLTGALITTAAFMPIGLSKSTTGEYAGGIFWIVGTAVVFSWFVSGVITPYLAVKMLPDFKKHGDGGDAYHSPFYRKLRGSIDFAVARRWWVIGATVAAFALAIAGSRLVPQQFFPNSDRPELVVELRLKEGSSFDATTEQVKKMKRCSRRTRMCASTPPTRAPGQPRFYLSLQSGVTNPGYAVLIVMTKDVTAREKVRARLMRWQRRTSGAWVRVTRLELGPPVGFPVQFRIVGPDTQKVREIARDVSSRRWSPRAPRCATCSSTGTTLSARLGSMSTRERRGAGTRAGRCASFVTQTLMSGATLSQLRQREDLVTSRCGAGSGSTSTLKGVNLLTRVKDRGAALSQVARARTSSEEVQSGAQLRHGDHGAR
jgi:multidrug efflux pump subunit AcrB